MKKHLVYLTGFMGSGKSTVGPLLARALGYEFLDLDHQIIEREHRSIDDIFSLDGERYFREAERQILEDVSRLKSVVISLGGGTMTNEESYDVVKNSGVLVYLKAEPERLFRRLQQKADRPLLRHPDGTVLSDQEMLFRIRWLIGERKKIYHQADVVVETDDKNVGKTVDEIVEKVRDLIL